MCSAKLCVLVVCYIRCNMESLFVVCTVLIMESVCVCVCVTMKKSAGRMASTTSNTGDTSRKQQQAQRKENYNKSKRPVSSVDHCHPYRGKKREEKQFTKPTNVAVCVCRNETKSETYLRT